MVGRHPGPVSHQFVPGPGDQEEVVVHIDYVDEVEGEQPEEEAIYPAGELEQLQGHGVVVLVLHLHLGPGPVGVGV